MDNNLRTADGATPIHIDRNMWGPAVQAGLDINLQDKWLVNFDVKKIWFNTDVYTTANGAKIDSLDLDPWVVSFGVEEISSDRLPVVVVTVTVLLVEIFAYSFYFITLF